MKQYFFLAVFSISFMVQGQHIDHQFNSWYTYSGNHQFSEKIGMHTLLSLRRNDFIKNWQQTLLRVGLNYKIHDRVTLMPGYDWVITFPYGKQPIGMKTIEHRIIEQIIIKHNVGRFLFNQQYKLEQRFVESTKGYDFFNRFRYRLTVTIPLNNASMTDRTFFIKAFDEIFLNFGPKTASYYFNQNWFYVGGGYQFKKNKALNVGYMNQFFPKSNNLFTESNHTLMLSWTYNGDFRKSKVEKK